MVQEYLQDPFIGRKRELEIYRSWLVNMWDRRILYFYDHEPDEQKKGGVGKTRLLEQCVALTRKQYPDITVVMIDFFSVADRDSIAIAVHIYKQLKKQYPQWSADAFPRALEEYEKWLRGWLSRGSEQDLQLKDEQSSELRSRLAEALHDDLDELNKQLYQAWRALIVFFDTFENIEDNPSVAVLSPRRKFPDDYCFSHIGFVIAGRNPLDWTHINWQGREKKVQSEALKPFTPEEIVEYMDSQAITLNTDEFQDQALVQCTGGRPILLGLVADIVKSHTQSLENLLKVPIVKFEEHLVSLINSNLVYQISAVDVSQPSWIILFMAHAYHHFNLSLLKWLLQQEPLRGLVSEEDDPQKLLTTISHLSFVRHSTSGEDFVLHDEMRPLVNKYCWAVLDPYKELRQEVSRRVIEYYENILTQEYSSDPRIELLQD